MSWILDKLPVLLFVCVAIYQVIKAVLNSNTARTTHEQSHDETEDQKRVREIQERIRRAIAERRGGRVEPLRPTLEPAQREIEPPVLRPHTLPVPPLEPFGGPPRRIFREMERSEPPKPVVAPVVETRGAELQRQVDLAEKIRVLAETNQLVKRRASNLLAARDEAANSEIGMLSASRLRLDEDLADPQSLRRAFVLREVLGPPVGLR